MSGQDFVAAHGKIDKDNTTEKHKVILSHTVASCRAFGKECVIIQSKPGNSNSALAEKVNERTTPEQFFDEVDASKKRQGA